MLALRSLRVWSRGLFAAIPLLLLTPLVFAQSSGSKLPIHTSDRSTERTRDGPDSRADREPAGNPILGVFIIAGVVGFLVLLAWLFSRVGEGNGRNSDTLN
jgi:hypothetical protein